MVVKIKDYSEKTRHVRNNDKSKKYILRGQRNARYSDRTLSNKKKSYNFTTSKVQKSIWHQSQRITFTSDTNHFNKFSTKFTKI